MSTPQTSGLDLRQQALQAWFVACQPQLAKLLPVKDLASYPLQEAGSDASFRRYFRWNDGHTSLVLMDAPPPGEDCRPFVKMAKLLAAADLNVPAILAEDVEQGFLVLSDLGLQTWLEVLNEHNADELFDQALDVLVRLQSLDVTAADVPSYDEALLRRELQLFPDWYLARELGVELNEQQQADWQQSCDLLVQAALAQPKVLVHRDFMPRNLMLSEPNPGVLDFQDAVLGPVSYDVISLFKDAFISWPEQRVQGWIANYLSKARAAGLAVPVEDASFMRDCDWMGLQRHLKVAGIFARICHRDGKPAYLQDVPRFLNYIYQVVGRYEELAPLRRLLASLPLPGEQQ